MDVYSLAPMKACTKNWMDIYKQLLAVPIGGASWALNALLLVAILRNRRLRSMREYWMTMALAFADFSEGFASFIGAHYRQPFEYSDIACNEYTTPLRCMTLPHNVIWRWSEPATAFMLVATALDRFIAISYPTFYFVKGNRVVISLIGIAYGIAALCFLYAWIMPVEPQIAGSMLPAVCLTEGLIDEIYTEITKYIAGAMSACSVAINFIVAFKVLLFMRRQKVRKYTEEPNISKRELKFTITSLIKGLITLLLDSSMRLYGVYLIVQENLTGADLETDRVGSFVFVFVAMNGALNVFVYARGQKEVRQAILSLFRIGNPFLPSVDHPENRKRIAMLRMKIAMQARHF